MAESRRMRSLLFVPGGRPDMIAKAGRSGADGVVVDLEDAVPADGKDAARRTAVEAITALDVPGDALVLVRVNAPGSPWYGADVAAAAASPADGVVLPKAGTAEQLHYLREALDRAGRPDAVMVVGLETAQGVAEARPLLMVGTDAGVVAAYFGAEDYIADLGGRRTAEGVEVLYARSLVALAGRLAGVAVLDQAVLAVHDDTAFRNDAERGLSLGYHGKLCIHPAQVPLAHQVFTPSDAEIAHARAVLDAVAVAGGAGVLLVDGQMVDDVHVRMARSVLARAE